MRRSASRRSSRFSAQLRLRLDTPAAGNSSSKATPGSFSSTPTTSDSGLSSSHQSTVIPIDFPSAFMRSNTPPSNGATPDWSRLNASISTSSVSDTTSIPNCSRRRSRRPRLETPFSSASNMLFTSPAGLIDTAPRPKKASE